MDVHLAEHGATTADKVHKREEFRELIADVQDLPETQRTALLLREIDALSYEQISEAMETTIPSIKSLLVRARVSLAEAAEARQLSCDEVRLELGEIAEGLTRRSTPPVRRHIRTCASCAGFKQQLRSTNKALAAVMPVGFVLALRKIVLAHLGLSAGAGGGASATGAAGAAAGSAVAGSATGGLISAGMSTDRDEGRRRPRRRRAGDRRRRSRSSIASRATPPSRRRRSSRRRPPTCRRSRRRSTATRRRRSSARSTRRSRRSPPKPRPPTDDSKAADRSCEAVARAPVETPPATTTAATPAPGRRRPTARPSRSTPTTPTLEPGQTQVESGTTALPSELPADQPPQTVAATTPPPPAATTATPPPTEPPARRCRPSRPTPPATTTPTPTTPVDAAGRAEPCTRAAAGRRGAGRARARSRAAGRRRGAPLRRGRARLPRRPIDRRRRAPGSAYGPDFAAGDQLAGRPGRRA